MENLYQREWGLISSFILENPMILRFVVTLICITYDMDAMRAYI